MKFLAFEYRLSGFKIVWINAILFHGLVEIADINTSFFRRIAYMAISRFQAGDNKFLFCPFRCLTLEIRQADWLLRGKRDVVTVAHYFWQVMGFDYVTFCEGYGSLYRILQFTDIAGEVVTL